MTNDRIYHLTDDQKTLRERRDMFNERLAQVRALVKVAKMKEFSTNDANTIYNYWWALDTLLSSLETRFHLLEEFFHSSN